MKKMLDEEDDLELDTSSYTMAVDRSIGNESMLSIDGWIWLN